MQIDYALPPKHWRHSAFKMLVASFAMAFAFAITFVIVMTLTLPRTDGAYGQMPFQDPLVFPVMAIGASFSALIVFPFFFSSCRSRDLGKSVSIIVGVTMTELLLVTPFNIGAGLLGSFIAFAVGLCVARKTAPLAESSVGDTSPGIAMDRPASRR